jgi:hypothetical protein
VRRITYVVLIQPVIDKNSVLRHYKAHCEALPECTAYGTSFLEAEEKFRRNMADYLYGLQTAGQDLPRQRVSVKFIYYDPDDFMQ